LKKIIIDTDPGIDDALALCYALNHPSLDVCALTTIFGNVETNLATDNALRLCELNRVAVPVATGASQPLTIELNPVADFVHGRNGFGEVELPKPTLKASNLSAAQTIVNIVNNNPGEVTLVAVGPLTNLALALLLSPDIQKTVAEVVVMGGAFHREGNVSKYAEANIWNDPDAAKAVFNAAWPVTVHGLDVTYKIAFSQDYLAELATNAKNVGGFLRDAAQYYIDFYQRQHGFEGCCPHDQLALTYVTKPEIFTLENGVIDVKTDGDELGKTTIDTSVQTNKYVAISVEKNALLADYTEVLSSAY